jgi:hypothetical protein
MPRKNGGGLVYMKFMTFSLILVLLFSASAPALAGTGCGSNWMGDTSGDTDFWVSQNQNLGYSETSSPTQPVSKTPAIPLGSTVQASKNATISGVSADLPSPQNSGTAIVWTVQASNPDNEKMLYDFLLRGPATEGQLTDMTGWIQEPTWTWYATSLDAGQNEIEVLVKRSGSTTSEDSEVSSYTIVAPPQSQNASTASVALQAAQISAPNGQTPDTSSQPTITQAAMISEPEVAPAEPETMEAEGKWVIKLDGSGSTLNPLTLIQTGDNVMGMGTLNDGSAKLQVDAKGSVAGNAMSLELWTVVSEYGNQIDKSIDLELVEVEQKISGSYEMHSGDELIGKGNVTASRSGS